MRYPLRLLAASAMLLVVALVLSGPSSSSQPNPTVSAIETQIAELHATITAIVEGSPAADIVILQDGPLTFDVTRIGELIGTELEQLSDFPTAGIYVRVDLTITNTSDEPVRYLDVSWWEFRLIDDQGRRFSFNPDHTYHLFSELDMFSNSYQPDLPVSGFIVFEVPTDATGFQVVLEEGAS